MVILVHRARSDGQSSGHMSRLFGMCIVLTTCVLAVAACASAPPQFAIEPASPAFRSVAAFRSFYVGPRVTPPGNLYRFARVYETGRVEVTELTAVNGPGPWLSYEGEVDIPAPVARELLAAADAAVNAVPSRADAATTTTTAASDDTRPCILAVAPSAGAAGWQGCGDQALAARVLSTVPRLAPRSTNTESECWARVCVIRLTFAAAARRHDHFGEIVRDVAIDASGAFWCAAPAPDAGVAPNALRVTRGQIRQADAASLFDWLLGDAARHAVNGGVAPRLPPAAAEAGVRILQADSGWTTVRPTQAASLTSRWTRIAARLPIACRE
jgi:hypothetical protein